MKQTIDKGAFRDAFHRMGRGDQFSYEALGMIYDYLTELEDDIGTEFELDPVGICCEFSEYADIDELREAFDHLDFPEGAGPFDVICVIEDDTGAVLRRFTGETGPFVVAQ